MWLNKLTGPDMTPLGWLGGKTSTQTGSWRYFEQPDPVSACTSTEYKFGHRRPNIWEPDQTALRRFWFGFLYALTLKALINFVADDILNWFYYLFRENTTPTFHANSHERSGLIFSEKLKKIIQTVVCCSCDKSFQGDAKTYQTY